MIESFPINGTSNDDLARVMFAWKKKRQDGQNCTALPGGRKRTGLRK